jgi:hypothetical protein
VKVWCIIPTKCVRFQSEITSEPNVAVEIQNKLLRESNPHPFPLSQILAYLRKTLYAVNIAIINPGTPSRKPCLIK